MPEIPVQISKLISVCCLKDIKTWEITSGFMVRNIAAKKYRVIVPDNEIKEFIKKISSTVQSGWGITLYRAIQGLTFTAPASRQEKSI
jgi:hypothetical protein